MTLFGGTSSVSLKNRLQAAGKDSRVKAILLAIDSPGGSVDGLAEVADTVREVGQGTPIYAQVDGWAMSAAYYIAAGAKEISAHRMDQVGSIGTYIWTYDDSRAMQDAGFDPVLITTGEYKGMGAPGIPYTQEQIAFLQEEVNAYFEDFLRQVSTGRGMSMKDTRAVADGRYWFAKEAKASGLIDRVRGFGDTLAAIQKRHGGPVSDGSRTRLARIEKRLEQAKKGGGR